MASVIGRKDPLLRLTVEERYWLHKVVYNAIEDALDKQAEWVKMKGEAEQAGRHEQADSYDVFLEVETEKEALLRSVSAALDVLQTRMLLSRGFGPITRGGGVSHV